MNLKQLFEIQGKLDNYIVEKKGLEGQELTKEKLLALQVELGECANEWRGFKFWSDDREPRLKVSRTAWREPHTNPLLEEYVDCLHFLLSIGLDFKLEKIVEVNELEMVELETITDQFIGLITSIGLFATQPNLVNYEYLFRYFLGLGDRLGFTKEEVEQAYLEKNKINHKRQESGY